MTRGIAVPTTVWSMAATNIPSMVQPKTMNLERVLSWGMGTGTVSATVGARVSEGDLAGGRLDRFHRHGGGHQVLEAGYEAVHMLRRQAVKHLREERPALALYLSHHPQAALREVVANQATVLRVLFAADETHPHQPVDKARDR